METNTARGESRRILGLLALGALVFAFYGSLVPLDYSPLPFDEAWERFRALSNLRTGMVSRSDWATNILLFVPLGFFALGWLWPVRGTWLRLLVSLLVWLAASSCSIGIEFTQFWFPPRTPSLNDIVAESTGALIGILFWWWRGPPLWAWVQRWREARGVTSVAEYLLWAYLAGMFFYNVLPLDLTISLVEIYHKWKAGGVNFIPFGYPTANLATFVYGIATDVVLWVPVGVLWVASGRRTPIQAFWWTLGAVFVLELLQFFVYSRVSDVTDLITGAAGGGIGALIGHRLGSVSGAQEEAADSEFGMPATRRGAGTRSERNLLPWLLLGLVGWIGVLGAVFWYPYDFNTERAFLRERLPLLLHVPFSAYYFGSEFRAVTELLHKILFFAPLGVLLALGRLQIRRFSPLRYLYNGLTLILILAVPMFIELGQVALPSKSPDSTDWMLEMIGVTAGYLVTIAVRNKMLLAARPRGMRRRFDGAGRFRE